MDVISQLKDRDIAKVIDATTAAFTPLLIAKEVFIKQIPFKSFKYGALERHHLDVYYPPSPPPGSTNSPVLFFCYGGGLTKGDRRILPQKFGLVYSNLAAYFARRGYVVVIPDYRLVPGVVYPQPAEDVRDAVAWTVNPENYDNLISEGSSPPDLDTIFLMGHSAGGLHILSTMLEPKVLPWEDEHIRRRIKGLILKAPPYDLSGISATPNAPAVIHYYGTLEGASANDPLNLYRRLPKTIAQNINIMPKMLMVQGENEPDFLLSAGDRFREAVKEKTGEHVKLIIAKGHNHISTSWALSTGEGEQWAEDVVKWLNEPRA